MIPTSDPYDLGESAAEDSAADSAEPVVDRPAGLPVRPLDAVPAALGGRDAVGSAAADAEAVGESSGAVVAGSGVVRVHGVGIGVSGGAGGVSVPAAQRRELSQAVVLTLFSGLVFVLVGAVIGLMMWQFDRLGDDIDAQGARIDRLETTLRGEIATLGTELRGEIARSETTLRGEIAAIHGVLLDHTDRLARLEAAAGLPRPG